MRFPAGKCAALTVERKIIEPDFVEELEPRFDLVNDLRRNRALLRRKIEMFDVLCRGRSRQFAELVNI